jgi:hypothetical protein
MLIEDGTGSGRTAAVNAQNKLEVVAITATTEHDTNHHNGLAFNACVEVTPISPDPSSGDTRTCVFYLKNTSEVDITLEGIDMRLGGTGEEDVIEIVGRDDVGSPIGGTTVTPANLNLGSGNPAEGTFLKGSNITGISGGVVLQKIWITSNGTKSYNFNQDIIVPKNRVVTIYSRNSVAELDLTLSFNYHPTIGER